MEEIHDRLIALQDGSHQELDGLAQDAVQILVVCNNIYADELSLGQELRRLSHEILNIRPVLLPIRNAIQAFLDGLGPGEGIWVRLRARRLLSSLLSHLRTAPGEAAWNAISLIPMDAFVLTTDCCNPALVRICGEVQRSGRELTILAVESDRTEAEVKRILGSTFGSLDVAIEVVPDTELEGAVERATLALVGAEQVLLDGSVTGTRLSLTLARSARGRIPFVVVCDSFRMDREKVYESHADLIPAELISQIVTEQGVFSPGNLP